MKGLVVILLALATLVVGLNCTSCGTGQCCAPYNNCCNGPVCALPSRSGPHHLMKGGGKQERAAQTRPTAARDCAATAMNPAAQTLFTDPCAA